MTVKSKEYHRSFLHLPSIGPTTTDVRNVWKKKGYMPAPGSFEYMQEAMQNRPVPKLGTEHQALQVVGSRLVEVRIFEKPDQKFRQFATPWELEWSRLVSIDRKRFFPVVDDKGTVIGYSGPVLSSEMLIGRATGYALIYTADETIRYHRMFVGNKALHAVADLVVYGDGLNYYSVMTDIGGEITSFRYAYPSLNGSAESTSFPGLAWLKVLQGGFKILMSSRNGVPSLGRQPTSPAPTPQRALPQGKATPPSGSSSNSGGAPSGGPPTNPSHGGPPTNPTNPTNPSNAKPGNPTISSPTSYPRVKSPQSRSQLEHEIELARQQAVAAAPKQTPLPVAINRIRREAGLPPLPKTTVIDAPAAIANEALVRRLHDEFVAWLKANPDAPLSFKLERLTRLNRATWRAPFPTD